jgi:hypothetical protein
MGIETRNSISHEIRCQGQREASDPGSLNQGGPLFQHTTSCLCTLAIMFDHR